MSSTKPPVHRTSLLLTLAILATAATAVPAAAQQRETPGRQPTAGELRQIHCVAQQIPQVRSSVQSARPPLLIVSGREHGTVQAPQGSCPADAPLPEGAQQIRYIRPHAAVDLYGARGQNGAVLIDLADPAALPQQDRAKP